MCLEGDGSVHSHVGRSIGHLIVLPVVVVPQAHSHDVCYSPHFEVQLAQLAVLAWPVLLILADGHLAVSDDR